jgi:hypothetical protein
MFPLTDAFEALFFAFLLCYQSVTKDSRLDHAVQLEHRRERRRGCMIVYLMMAVLAAVAFLCVSPLVSQLASRKPGEAGPSKSHANRTQTFQAR